MLRPSSRAASAEASPRAGPDLPGALSVRVPALTRVPPPGGLAAVIYTDALQTVIMLVGALTLMGYSK